MLEYVYGSRYGRDNPHSTDAAVAGHWFQLGLTVPVACFVFYRQTNLMHERWLRDDLKDRSHIPHSLKIFDENIDIAIRRAKVGEQTAWETSEIQWVARLRGWKKNPKRWIENMWGPPPNQTGCRAPESLLRELT